MTDPIKEQAEKEAERLWRVSCPEYLSWPLIDHEDKGKWVKCDWKMLKEIFYELIEKHIREKASLESQLAEAKAELNRKDAEWIEETDQLKHHWSLEMDNLKSEVERLRERADLFQTTMIKYHKQFTQERQLADELAQSCMKCANTEEHREIVLKHKKRRGEG